MPSERQFEYEKGPRLEDEQATTTNDGGDVDDDGSDTAPRRVRNQLVVRPWKAGAVVGVSAFVVVFTVLYQLVGAMFAGGVFDGGETRPSRLAITGLVTLANHGVTLERRGETIQGAFGFIRGLTSHVAALVPTVVLLAAGYLVVRYAHLETRREAGLALGSLVGCYVILMVGLSMTAEWSPDRDAGINEEVPTVTASTDFGTVVSIGTTAIVFVTIGAAVAALPKVVAARR